MIADNRQHNNGADILCNCALKEWAISCHALLEGEQTLVIRKGGIREEAGVFRVQQERFLLLPAYEHQKAHLLQPQWAQRLQHRPPTPLSAQSVLIEGYAEVEAVFCAQDEAQVNALAQEHIWNEAFVKDRFNFNPYDPLYLIVLRAYVLPQPVPLAMRPEYGGCKSWVTLENALSLNGAMPALSDAAFMRRLERIQETIMS